MYTLNSIRMLWITLERAHFIKKKASEISHTNS